MGKKAFFIRFDLKQIEKMRSILIFCCIAINFASTLRFTNKEAARDKDHAARLGCSIQQLLACEAEIEAALEDCSHIIDDPASILKCINDILGATDCQVCICDVLPFLC